MLSVGHQLIGQLIFDYCPDSVPNIDGYGYPISTAWHYQLNYVYAFQSY